MVSIQLKLLWKLFIIFDLNFSFSGSGIFISPTTALAGSGSIGVCLIVWALSGVLSLLGALAYAELATLVPKSGGEYSYFLEAFKHLNSFWSPLPSFLCGWIYILIFLPAGNSVTLLAFAEYVCSPFSSYMNTCSEAEKDVIKKCVAIGALGKMRKIVEKNFVNTG